jgi:hypothetical protein
MAVNDQVIYRWTTRLFDFFGDPVNVDYSGYSENVTTNDILHGTSRNINFYLNGVDDCSFTLYLDDPMAAEIAPLTSIIKIYRHIFQADGTTPIYENVDNDPVFVGIVGNTLKDGDANTMVVNAFSPLWRLQSRFHVFNHYLKTNPATSNPYKQSELMWKLIDLLNSAFPAHPLWGYTGIEVGTFSWGAEPEISPYFVAKGSNTWSLIFDDIMTRVAGSDIIPEYFHVDGDQTLMLFSTAEKRGSDLSSTIKFNYRTGTNDNCDNITEEYAANPGEMANFLWVIGQGGANSGKVAVALDTTGDWQLDNIGLFMKTVDKSDVKRLTALQPIADAELAQSKIPKGAHTVVLNPYPGIYYEKDYEIGDVVMLNANKNALQVSNKKQRIYQCGLAISDNNVETATPLVANDFYGKVAA